MSSWQTRYAAGEFEQVWAEMLALGEGVQQAQFFSEAYCVACETMARVRTNLEMLIARLDAVGFELGKYPDGDALSYFVGARVPPPHNIGYKIKELETLVGTIPLSLKVFWQVVGSVNLIGFHPNWPDFSDPLVVEPIETAFSEYNYWRERYEDEGPDEAGTFVLPIAPDVFHKDNVSGGLPYGMKVPNMAIDAKVENEEHDTTFVSYLRICFGQGGFPGAKQLPLDLTQLTKGFLPF